MINNELTLKINTSIKQFKKDLESNGYKEIEHFILYDSFLVPETLEINKTSTRDIISSALIIRKVDDITHNQIRQDVSYKNKKYSDNGDIIAQKSTRMKIINCNEAELFFTIIGYKKIMNITEEDFSYKKDGIIITTKDIKNGDNLIEIEIQDRNDEYDSIEKLKRWIKKENLNLDYNNYFVKKAEIELNKILKR